ncbi:MAG: hypothetical protein AB1757_12255 [Acidobacteriota bacterium]
MRRRKQAEQALAPSARKAGNLLMGLATPIVSMMVMKFLPAIDFDTYSRVLQTIFIAAQVLFIAGILPECRKKSGKARREVVYGVTSLSREPDSTLTKASVVTCTIWSSSVCGCAALMCGKSLTFRAPCHLTLAAVPPIWGVAPNRLLMVSAGQRSRRTAKRHSRQQFDNLSLHGGRETLRHQV